MQGPQRSSSTAGSGGGPTALVQLQRLASSRQASRAAAAGGLAQITEDAGAAVSAAEGGAADNGLSGRHSDAQAGALEQAVQALPPEAALQRASTPPARAATSQLLPQQQQQQQLEQRMSTAASGRSSSAASGTAGRAATPQPGGPVAPKADEEQPQETAVQGEGGRPATAPSAKPLASGDLAGEAEEAAGGQEASPAAAGEPADAGAVVQGAASPEQEMGAAGTAGGHARSSNADAFTSAATTAALDVPLAAAMDARADGAWLVGDEEQASTGSAAPAEGAGGEAPCEPAEAGEWVAPQQVEAAAPAADEPEPVQAAGESSSLRSMMRSQSGAVRKMADVVNLLRRRPSVLQSGLLWKLQASLHEAVLEQERLSK